MLEGKIEKIIKALLYLTCFIPLIFIEGFYYPFIIGKTVFFRLIIQLAFSLYLLLLAQNFKKYKPKFSFVFILVLIMLIENFIAALFGYDFYKSFWSNFERMEGLLSLVYLVFYLYLIKVIFKEKKDWLFYIKMILLVSSLVSLYGLVQKFNILPVFEAGVNRIASTVGNAAFLAGFLLLSIGLGVYYILHENNKKYKNFALLVIILDIVALLLTSTRGAILGIVGGGLVFLFLNIFFYRGVLKKYSIISLIISFVIIGGFYFSRGFLVKSKIEFINRLASISPIETTIKNRLLVWRMAVEEFKNRPWLGVGLENFDTVYNKYYTPATSEKWFDRTHNIYLDQLINNGVFGLAVYLFIFAYLFYRLFKERKTAYLKFSVLTSLLIGYGIHNFFVFDTINTSFVYFFLICFVCFKDSIENTDQYANREKGKANNLAVNFTFFLLVIFNLYAFNKLIYLPLKINRNLYLGYYYTVADTERSYNNFKTALNYKFGSSEAAYQLVRMFDILESGNQENKEQLQKFYELTKDKLKYASDNYPLDIRTKLHYGQLIVNHDETEEVVNLAEAYLVDSVRLSPGRPEASYLLYNLYLKKGEKDKADEILYKLVEKLPWFGEAKIMLASALREKDQKQADEYFNQGLEQISGFDSSILLKIIPYLLNSKKYKEVIPYYLKLIEDRPGRYDYRIDLSKVYYLTGDIDSAVEQINIVNSKSPEVLKGNEQYLNLLEEASGQK